MSAFSQSGIRNVHMDDIATSLSISKRTLYEIFHDKECLLLEGVRWQRAQMKAYMTGVARESDDVLAVLFAFYQRKLSELCELNPLFLRDLRKYPGVVEYMHEERKSMDDVACQYFKKGVEQGIFRADINFGIINEAMRLQFDMLIYSDITENYPLSDIYKELTTLHLRGITTQEGYERIDAFLRNMQKNQGDGPLPSA